LVKKFEQKPKKSSLNLRYSKKLYNFWIKYFTKRDRNRFIKHMKNGKKYKTVTDKIFRKHGLPTDLFYIGLVESGYNAKIRSRAGAIGPWQFVRGTGKRYGLRIDHSIDERRNIFKATEAAAKYFKDLYNIFGSWELALCAYNKGEYGMIRAIRKGKTRDYRRLIKLRLIPKAFELASSSGDEAKKEDLKKTLELFDNLQWGDGPVFGTLSKKIKEKFLANIDSSVVLKHFRELIAKDTFIYENKTYIHSDILETIIFKSILHEFYSELKKLEGAVLKKLSDMAFTNTKCYSLAFEMFLLRDKNVKDEEIFQRLGALKENSLLKDISDQEVHKSLNHFLYNKEKKCFEKSKHFFSKVGKDAQLVATIIPFREIEHDEDIDSALEIFALPKGAGPDLVKKRYKELALSRHPDRLAGKNIPEGLQKQAHVNFTTLQRAYDIIKAIT